MSDQQFSCPLKCGLYLRLDGTLWLLCHMLYSVTKTKFSKCRSSWFCIMKKKWKWILFQLCILHVILSVLWLYARPQYLHLLSHCSFALSHRYLIFRGLSLSLCFFPNYLLLLFLLFVDNIVITMYSLSRALMFVANTFKGVIPAIELNDEDGELLASINRELTVYLENMERCRWGKWRYRRT